MASKTTTKPPPDGIREPGEPQAPGADPQVPSSSDGLDVEAVILRVQDAEQRCERVSGMAAAAERQVAELVADFERQVAGFQQRLEAALGEADKAVQRAIAATSAAADEDSRASVGKLADEMVELRESIGRIATALGRQDFLSPPATMEQVGLALRESGCRLLVLRDYKLGGLDFKAGRKIEGSAFSHDKILAGVGSGRLSVAILPRAEA